VSEVPAAGDVTQPVVPTAAQPSPHPGPCSAGRVPRSTAVGGSAPTCGARVSRSRVPCGGILSTGGMRVLGPGRGHVAPADAFGTLLDVAATGSSLATWGMITTCRPLLGGRPVSASRPGRRTGCRASPGPDS
jgi:L-asparagine permease